jgi:hypothetical protein
MMRTTIRLHAVFLVLLFYIIPLVFAARGGGFLRDGFNNRMEREFGSEASQQVDELGGMSPEMLVLKNQEWELGGVRQQLNVITDKDLRKHVQQFIAKPALIKGTGVAVRTASNVGYKAVAKTAQNKKLRAVWKQGTVTNRVTSRDLLSVSYDDAIRRRTGATHVQWELILPPVPGSRTLPSVVYTVPIQLGSVNPEAVVVSSEGSVVLYPNGSKDKANKIELGTVSVTMAMKAGLVDPSWARGRTIFRKGRSVGFV